MAATRRLVHDGLTRDLDDQLDAETTSISRLAATADAREGIRAFGAHEQPRFRGDDGSAVG
jgi:enoyl-CoA hydratase/carnithine racemase